MSEPLDPSQSDGQPEQASSLDPRQTSGEASATAGWTPKLVADNRGLAAVSVGKAFKKRPASFRMSSRRKRSKLAKPSTARWKLS